MKKLISILILLVVMVCGMCIGSGMSAKANETSWKTSNLYALTTVIVEINDDCKLVTCKDFNGNLWRFTTCEGDWIIGDIVSMVMYDRNTPIIYDDEIVSVKYNGWFNGWKW